MAVITRYIVERNGEEKMTFVSKKDADAYDKELDIAEDLQELLSKSDIEIGEDVLESLSLYIARNRDSIGLILKGSKPKKAKKKDQPDLQAVEAAIEENEESNDSNVSKVA